MGNQGSSGSSQVYIIPGQKEFKNRNNSVDNSKVSGNIKRSLSNVEGNNNYQGNGNNLQNRNKQYKYKVSFIELKEVFRHFAGKSDHLTKAQFNDSIQKIFNFPDIPYMHYTHLSEKIYHLLDDSGDGKIQEDEFVKGFMNALCVPEYRYKLNFLVMMDHPDFNKQFITLPEIQKYIYESWIKGFRHLAWMTRNGRIDLRKQNLPIITDKQAIHWAEKYKTNIYVNVRNSFMEIGLMHDYNSIDMNMFTKWLQYDRNLHYTYGNFQLHIAISLLSLDNIGFDTLPSNFYDKYNSTYPPFN